MTIAIFTMTFVVSLLILLLGNNFFKKEHNFGKVISFFGIGIFFVRLFCYKSIISADPNSFLGLGSSSLHNNKLTLFCLILIWFEYTSIILALCRNFFKIKVLDNIVKYLVPVVSILQILFINPICLILQGDTTSLWLPVFLSLESAIGLSLSIDCIISNTKKISIKETLKGLGLSIVIFLLFSIFTLPSYFIQYTFGYLKITNTWLIKDFTPYHRYVLYGNIIIPFIIYYALRNKSDEFKRFALIFISLAVLVGFVVNYDYTTLSKPWSLPFHLCNTALFILPLVLIFKMKRLFYFTYFINVVGALLAMLLPNYAAVTNIFSMRMFNFWYNHYIAFFLPLLFVALKQFERPKLKQFIYSMLSFGVYFIIVLILNVYFTANGHSVDYFFINSDFIADKLGLWAERIFNMNLVLDIKGVSYEFHPLYQVIFFGVYILIGLAVWFVYEEAYRIADGSAKLFERLRKIRIDEYALKSALNGRKMGDPMEKDAGVRFELRHFSKKYASSKKYAVNDANLVVNGGEIFGFLGPNGAGKSTIIKSTVGIQSITDGNILICGYDVSTQPVEAKSNIGYVPDHYALYEKLTGREYLNYIADIYNVSKKDRDERLKKYIERFQLEGSIDNMIKTYSHGMKQKITIMSALIHNPKVWILDEPLTGLDPNSIYQVKECMKEHAQQGNIVFFSSHLIDVVEKLCQRIAIIKHGQILCVKNVNDLENNEKITLEEFYLKMIEGNEEENIEEKKN